MNTRIAALLFAGIYLSGCTTLSPVERFADRPASSVSSGEKVAITTRSGATRELALTRVTADEICADRECVAVAEIAALEKREFSVWKTALLVALVVVVAIGAAGGGGSFLMAGPPVLP